jgi:thiol-disulfide isomerase/thioredoxin
MIIMNNLLRRAGALLAVTLPVVALGCSKEAPSTAARKPSRAPAAAVASEVEPPVAPAPGAAQAGLTHVTAEELRVVIRASRKKGTLVNAWASWCGPCREELPMLQALATNLKPQGVSVLLVSVDEPKDEAKALSFLKDNGITLTSYVVEGSIADFKQGINPRWPGMLPASFLFDGTAGLVHFWGGEAFENELTPVIEAFLAGSSIEAETRYGLAPGKVE